MWLNVRITLHRFLRLFDQYGRLQGDPLVARWANLCGKLNQDSRVERNENFLGGIDFADSRQSTEQFVDTVLETTR